MDLKAFVTFCVLLASLAPARGEGGAESEIGRPLLQAFTPRDYHGHNQIWAGAQDAAGVMWFGTAANVLSYDGSVWRQIPVPMAHVRALGFDSNGKLYLGGPDALGYLEPGSDGRPVYRSLLDQLPASVRSPGVVWSLATTSAGVFFATDRQVLRWVDGHFLIYAVPEPTRQSVKSLDGTLWLHRRGIGLFRFDGTQFRLVSAEPQILHSRFLALISEGPGGLLVAADGGSFFRLQGERLVRAAVPAAPLLAGAQVLAGLRLANGDCALATIGGGIWQLDAGGTLIRHCDESNGLPNQGVINLAADRDGGTWICTQNGMVRAELAAPWTIFDEANGLTARPVLDLKRHRGFLWAGTHAGLWRLAPGSSASGRSARFELAAASGRAVWSLLSHSSGLLMATDDGVRLYDGQNPPPLIVSSTAAVQRLTAARESADLIYLGRSDGVGRMRFDGRSWEFEGLVRSPVPVTTLAEDPSGIWWAGTESRGFARVDPPGSPQPWFRSQLTFLGQGRGLPAEPGNCRVIAGPQGVMFLTDHGTYRYDAAARRFEPDGRVTSAGLSPDSSLWPMSVSAEGVLWSEYSAQSQETNLIGQLADSQPGRWLWHPLPVKLNEAVSFAAASGLSVEGSGPGEEVWIHGEDASVRVSTGSPIAAPAPWRAFISSVTLPDGTSLVPPPAGSARERLPFSREPLRITFAAPHFGRGPLEFRTRLAGYSRSWSPWSARTEAVYTNLWGGPFSFEVQGRDADGATSVPARWTFSVAPPPFLSAPALIADAVALAAAIGFFLRWRLRRAELERRRLESLVAVRTADLAVARDAAESANRAKSTFLAAMSHELRTPLNGVLGYAQLLQRDPALGAEQRERVRIVEQSGDHLLRLINEVLDLAKIEAGKIRVQREPFALADLLHDVSALHRSAALAKGLDFSMEMSDGLPSWVEGDAQKLRQVLDNLLGNAVKFTTRGRVILRVRTTDAPTHEITWEVIDTGPGISPADQQRVGQRFERVDSSVMGTGLGLAISRSLLEHCGGQLRLASIVGGGTTFSFALKLPPAPRPTAPPAISRGLSGYAGPRRRVVVIDDQSVNRRLLMDLLGPLGFECREFDSALSALQGLASSEEPWPDLVLLDVQMPELDGREAAGRLRRLPRGDELTIILLSASVFAFDPEAARQVGYDDVAFKPLRAAELLEKIGRLLHLDWEEGDILPIALPPEAALPAPMRRQLREVLSSGDLSAFADELGRLRAAHPSLAAAFGELAQAAAGFQLSRLRQLLS